MWKKIMSRDDHVYLICNFVMDAVCLAYTIFVVIPKTSYYPKFLIGVLTIMVSWNLIQLIKLLINEKADHQNAAED